MIAYRAPPELLVGGTSESCATRNLCLSRGPPYSSRLALQTTRGVLRIRVPQLQQRPNRGEVQRDREVQIPFGKRLTRIDIHRQCDEQLRPG